MSVLVLAEHDHVELTPGTLATVTAAKTFNKPIHLLILGEACQKVAEEAVSVDGIEKVLVVEEKSLKEPIAELMTPTVAKLAESYSYLLAPSSTFGKNILPRVAALHDVAQLSDVVSIENDKTFVRPIYAGNAFATVESQDALKIMTIRPTAFDKAEKGPSKASLETAPFIKPSSPAPTFVKLTANVSERPELTSAAIVVSGGRGFQTKENFALVEALADKLHAAIGASRAAVDAGFVPNDYQVGQTGKVVAPNLYMAIGISGAIQHLAGMKDSKVIVAINKDPEAPIFAISDYWLVGDLFKIVPELIEKLPLLK